MFEISEWMLCYSTLRGRNTTPNGLLKICSVSRVIDKLEAKNRFTQEIITAWHSRKESGVLSGDDATPTDN